MLATGEDEHVPLWTHAVPQEPGLLRVTDAIMVMYFRVFFPS